MSDKTEYYKIRLEHTLKHTQEATRLIYLVNAGLLVFIAFLWDKLRDLESIGSLLTLLVLIIMAFVNWFHYKFIKRNGLWYRDLRIAYWKRIRFNRDRDEIIRLSDPEYKDVYITDLFANIHLAVFWGIVIVLVILIFYFFPSLICVLACC